MTHLAFLVTGTVALSVLGHSWNRRIVMLLSATEGHEWLLDPTVVNNARHSLTCEALTEVEVYLLQKSTFEALMERDCSLSCEMSHMLSELSGRTIAEFQNQVVRSASERLARILLQLAQSHGHVQGNRTRVTLPLKRQDLAALVGVSKETLIRMLQAFRNDGLVDLVGPEIDIVSEPGLRTLANQIRSPLDQL